MSNFLKGIERGISSGSAQLNQAIYDAGQPFLKSAQDAIGIIKKEEKNLEFLGREEYNTFWTSGKIRDVILRHHVKEECVGSIKDFKDGVIDHVSIALHLLVIHDSKYLGKVYPHKKHKFSISLAAYSKHYGQSYNQIDFKTFPEKAWSLALYPFSTGDGFTSRYIDLPMSGEELARLFFEIVLKNSRCRVK